MGVDGGPAWVTLDPLTNESYGDNALRDERVKLAVVACDDLATEFLRERDTKTVG